MAQEEDGEEDERHEAKEEKEDAVGVSAWKYQAVWSGIRIVWDEKVRTNRVRKITFPQGEKWEVEKCTEPFLCCVKRFVGKSSPHIEYHWMCHRRRLARWHRTFEWERRKVDISDVLCLLRDEKVKRHTPMHKCVKGNGSGMSLTQPFPRVEGNLYSLTSRFSCFHFTLLPPPFPSVSSPV